MADWYVFTTQPGKERAVGQALRNRGYLSLVPIIKKPCRARGGRGPGVLRETSVVPGYVFVSLDGTPEAFEGVFETRAIRTLIQFDDQPGRISEEVMDGFLKRIAAAPVIPIKPALKVGGIVRIKGGPFVGWVGRLQKVKGAAAHVILDLFGRSSKAQCTVDGIEPVDATSTEVSTKRTTPLHRLSKSLTTRNRMTADRVAP